jgi:hypothetical protein
MTDSRNVVKTPIIITIDGRPVARVVRIFNVDSSDNL